MPDTAFAVLHRAHWLLVVLSLITILGAVAGVLGTLQAVEVLKELLQLGESLDGTLLIYDALRARFHSIRINKDPDCPTCGAHG